MSLLSFLFFFSKQKTAYEFLISDWSSDVCSSDLIISFVKDVLFPYARQALPGFVRARGDEPEVRQWLDQVAMENGGVCQDAMIVETLQGWIDQDRKHTALKALQIGRAHV